MAAIKNILYPFKTNSPILHTNTLPVDNMYFCIIFAGRIERNT